VGPRAGLDAVVKRKNSLRHPCRELNPGRQAQSLATILSYTGSYKKNETKCKASDTQLSHQRDSLQSHSVSQQLF
jgi:hypothetical protein